MYLDTLYLLAHVWMLFQTIFSLQNCESSDDEDEERITFPSQESEGCALVQSQQSAAPKAKAGNMSSIS